MSVDPLAEVRAAAAAAAEADEQLRAAVLAAKRADVATDSEIAKAAGISRPTLYRWIAQADAEDPEAPRPHPAQAMDAALELLMELGGGPFRELLAGLRVDDLAAKARRVQIGIKNLPPGIEHTAHTRAVLGAGVDAAERALSRRRRPSAAADGE